MPYGQDMCKLPGFIINHNIIPNIFSFPGLTATVLCTTAALLGPCG